MDISSLNESKLDAISWPSDQDSPAAWSHISTILIGLVLFSLDLWTVIGNCMVLIALSTNKQLKKGGISNYLIGNLAFSDLLLGLTVLPFSASLSTFKTWHFGSFLCDLWLCVDVLCSSASIWGLLAIALDRFIATNYPVKYMKQKNSFRTALLYIAVSWIISFLISLGPLIFKFGNYDPAAGPRFGLRTVNNRDECVLFQTPSFVILSSLVSFFLPLVLMICLYLRVFLRIRQQKRLLDQRKQRRASCQTNASEANRLDDSTVPRAEPGSKSDTQHNNNEPAVCQAANRRCSNSDATALNTLLSNEAKKPKKPNAGSAGSEARVTKTLAIIMSCFVACWLPFFIIYIIRSQLNDPDSIAPWILDIFIWLGYFNSALNPILYAILNRNFRTAFANMFKCQFA
nr:G protein-coupled receptor [Proales similis]